VKVINGHVNVLVDDDGTVKTARELVAGLVEAGNRLAELEAKVKEQENAIAVYRNNVVDRLMAYVEPKG